MQITQSIESNRIKATVAYARLIQRALTQLGYTSKHGEVEWPVIPSNAVYYRPKDAGLVEIDVHRLPRGVRIDKLTNDKTLHHLSSVIGRPVRIANGTSGLTYVIPFGSQKKQPLPRHINLNLSNRPQGDYMIGIGRTRGGDLWVPLQKSNHWMIAGSTDSGKSTFLRSFLYQLLRQPLPVDLYLSDMEGLTFAIFEDSPALKAPIAETVTAVEEITEKILLEMEERSIKFAATGRFPESLPEYHRASNERLPWIVLVMDEFSPLIDAAGQKSQLYDNVAQLAMRSRKYGITLVMAGQDFKADLLNTRISNQILTRIQFQCVDETQSRVVLGEGGAEKIRVQGRALARVWGDDKVRGDLVEVQAFYKDKGEIIDGLGITVEGKKKTLLEDIDRRIAQIALNDRGRLHQETVYEGLGGGASNGGLSYTKLNKRLQRWDQRGWSEKTRNGRVVTDTLRELVNQNSKVVSLEQERVKRDFQREMRELQASVRSRYG